MEHKPKIPKLLILVLSSLILFLMLIHFNYPCKNLSLKSFQEVPSKSNYIYPPQKNCDLFRGEWVRSQEDPYYTNATCRTIQNHQNCMKNGRTDDGYLKWRWRPSESDCDLPIFDPIQFLEIVRGKSLAFVGDSVARNHMQSLLCMLSKVENPIDVSESPESQFKRYEYKAHNFTIQIFWSPYLVKTTQTKPNDTSQPFNLYLDEFDETWTTKIESFDYVIISAGQWFKRPTMFYINKQLIGCLWCDQNDITHLGVDFSFQMAYKTAFKAINSLVNYKGVTFLRTFATSHFENGDWDKGGDCTRTRPYEKNGSRLKIEKLDFFKIQIQEFENAVKPGNKNGMKFRLFDVTRAMLMRPDGHPSHYGNLDPTWPNDCVHWCLPGPIDMWNELLLEMLKREKGKS